MGVARKLHAALEGPSSLLPEATVDALVERAQPSRRRESAAADHLSVDPDRVRVEEAREAGAVHVGHQMWRRLTLDAILAEAGLSARARVLAEVMTLNRLVSPAAEHAMPDWIRRTALADILGEDFSTLSDEALYRNLDRLHPQRETIERALATREHSLFTLDDTLYFYDLTSSYFEGQCPLNRQAKRGYSRDKRPDCKQVVIGLVVDGEGFPKAHEVFDGNLTDRTTLDEMLGHLEKRTGRRQGATVVVDRGLAFDDNLAQIRARGHHYVVAARQSERAEHHRTAFAEAAGWTEVLRTPSPRNPGQQKTRVVIKRQVVGAELHILCRSDGRIDKDRAIRDTHEQRFLADLTRLQTRVAKKRVRAEAKVHEAIGRLKERYPDRAANAGDPSPRLQALGRIAPLLPDDLLRQAIEASTTIRDGGAVAGALLRLSADLPAVDREPMQHAACEALWRAQRDGSMDASVRRLTICQLLPRFDEPVLGRVLDPALTLPADGPFTSLRADALKALVGCASADTVQRITDAALALERRTIAPRS